MAKLGVLLLLATVLVGCETPSEPTPSGAENAQYQAAFQAMLRDPGNLQTVMIYAEAATKVGDYEGAIGAYESLMLLNSDLPWVRLELGVLYFRLKSYDVSRVHLQAALASTSVTADVRRRAERQLAKLPKPSTSNRA